MFLSGLLCRVFTVYFGWGITIHTKKSITQCISVIALVFRLTRSGNRYTSMPGFVCCWCILLLLCISFTLTALPGGTEPHKRTQFAYFWPCLARSDLRALWTVKASEHFGRHQICTQVLKFIARRCFAVWFHCIRNLGKIWACKRFRPRLLL